MALNPKLSNAAANAAADAVTALLNNGYLRIYSGVQPATADTALSGNTLLAELRFANPASGAAAAGVSTLNAIADDASADNTGTAAWFRALQSNGSTVVLDGSVATATADLILNTTAISAGAAVGVTSFTYTQSKS